MSKAWFSNIDNINYEGSASTNPLAFKFYNPEEVIGDKTMEEILRYGLSYWHTFTIDGSDPIGAGTMVRPWDAYK